MFSFAKSIPTLVNVVKNRNLVVVSNLLKMSTKHNFKTLSVTVPKEYVYQVELNRPDNLNSISDEMWREFSDCFQQLHEDENCRVIVLSAAGRLFCAGIDLKSFMKVIPEVAAQEDVARKAKIFARYIKVYQSCISALESCQKPVIAAVHNACIGGGVHLITAADIRYCSKDAWFQIKEVAIGMTADVGVLQRLPKIVGNDSLVRELCYTARKMPAPEALSFGLVSKVFEDKESTIEGSLKLAEEIAKLSPVAVQGTKLNLVYSRDHTVQEGLNHIGMYNQAMLQSEDFINAVTGQMTKNPDIIFSKL